MPLKVQSGGAAGALDQGCIIAGNKRTETASMQREGAGQFQIRREIARRLARQAGNEARVDKPSARRQHADVAQPFGQRARRLRRVVARGIAGFELHDVEGRAGLLQRVVHRRRQCAETKADAERGFAPERFQQRQHHLAHHHRVFAALDIDVRDAGGTVMDEQFSNLFVAGAITMQGAIVAAHPAIGAILAAKI